MKKLNLEDILSNTSDLKDKKVWFIAIIWRPNAWKSTFMNALIWEKVSIVTSVPQTTRKKVLWIYNDEDSQIVFFDTPWIHNEEKAFNKAINSQATSSLREADAVLYFVDSSRPKWEEEKYIEGLLENFPNKIIKVYTKVDLESKVEIPEDAIKISSVSVENWFNNLLIELKKDLPLWKTPYPDDYYTKQDMTFRISEVIREKLFLNTKQELPHSSFVEVEEIDDSKNGLLKIVAYIYTETESQKYIVIWKNWSLITKVWKEARLELEEIFSKKIFLALRAKKAEKWRKNEKIIKRILD